MILNGKAKHDFLNWITKGMSSFAHDMEIEFFNQKSEIEKNAIIIEWFDSMGIYINVGGVLMDCLSDFSFDIQTNNTLNGIDNSGFNSRSEATKKAILKANEIYNSK